MRGGEEGEEVARFAWIWHGWTSHDGGTERRSGRIRMLETWIQKLIWTRMTMTWFQIGEAPARQGGGGRSHGRGEECGHGPNMIVYRKMEVIMIMILMMMMCLQKYGGHHHSDPRHLIFNYILFPFVWDYLSWQILTIDCSAENHRGPSASRKWSAHQNCQQLHQQDSQRLHRF